MNIIGSIYKVDIAHKLIAIKTFNKLNYFYFQNSQLQVFKRYLYEGVYINLEYEEHKVFRKNKINAFLVNYVNQIYSMSMYKKISYYDKKVITGSLSKFLSSLGNIMFLDLEMTMPSYGFHGSSFQSEIVQAGYILIDNNGEEITRYSNYIKPVVHKELSNRVLKFLNLDYSEFYSKAITYQEFYDDFKEIIDIYHPAIVVYGKNDSITLNSSYKINNVQSLEKITRFVNISKIIKNYYNLKNDPGLFKLYQIYYNNDNLQVHDAFNDSMVTKEVFKAFKDDVNHKTNFYEEIRKHLQ